MNARLLDLTPGEYHRPPQPGKTPDLTQSLASVLLDWTPLHARKKLLSRGRTKPASEESAKKQKVMEWGTLVHHCVLGERDDRVVVASRNTGLTVEPFDDWRTKEAQSIRKAAHATGKVPVLERQLGSARATAARIKAELGAHGFEIVHDPARGLYCEQAIEWTEKGWGGEIVCRGMIDFLVITRSEAIVLDIKTTADARKESFQRSIEKHGYSVQAAAYTRAIEVLVPHLAGRVRVIFALAETGSGEVRLNELSEGYLHIGRRRWQRAVDVWSYCIASGEWPGYAKDVQRIEPPDWVLHREQVAAGDHAEMAITMGGFDDDDESEDDE